MSERFESWLSMYPDDCLPLALAHLRSAPDNAISIMRRHWLGTSEGDARIADVLSRAQKLGPEVGALVELLIPTIVQSSAMVLMFIGKAVQAHDPKRAATLYVRWALEERRRRANKEPLYSQHTLGLLEALSLSAESLLDLIEPMTQSVGLEPQNERDEYEESIEATLGKLLTKLAQEDPSALVRRAVRQKPGANTEDLYVSAMSLISGHCADRVAWTAASPTRLSYEHESVRLVASLAADNDLNQRLVDQLESAIDTVQVENAAASDHLRGRRYAQRKNRAYRLSLRDKLPSGLRSKARLMFDESEGHQVDRSDAFQPRPRGGCVQSPMSVEQLSVATDAAVIRAIEKERPRIRFTESDLPVEVPRKFCPN